MSFSRPTIAQPVFCSFQSAPSGRELLIVLLGQREFIFAAYVLSKCESACFAETRTFQTVSHTFRLHRVVARGSTRCTITVVIKALAVKLRLLPAHFTLVRS